MPTPGENLRIDGARLWDSIMEMAKIGPGIAGGNNRQTLTDADAEGRALFRRWCEAAGLTLGVDAMGTMFATRAGEDPEALPVHVGSHLDTQPTGGKYDGVLGVLGALEAVRSMNDLGIRTRHPIVVVNWTNEEGARFAPAMLASGVFAGVIDLDYAYGRTDLDGKRFGDELERIGWKGEEQVGARKMHAYFELHIEQGPILEAEGREIGVVTHCQGLWWLEFTLTGREAHTGSTPMGDAGQRRAGDGADHRDGAAGGDGEPARCGRRGRAGEVPPELAQRAAREGRVHRRHPLAGPGEARRDAGDGSSARRRRSATGSGSAARSSRSGTSTR